MDYENACLQNSVDILSIHLNLICYFILIFYFSINYTLFKIKKNGYSWINLLIANKGASNLLPLLRVCSFTIYISWKQIPLVSPRKRSRHQGEWEEVQQEAAVKITRVGSKNEKRKQCICLPQWQRMGWMRIHLSSLGWSMIRFSKTWNSNELHLVIQV